MLSQGRARIGPIHVLKALFMGNQTAIDVRCGSAEKSWWNCMAHPAIRDYTSNFPNVRSNPRGKQKKDMIWWTWAHTVNLLTRGRVLGPIHVFKVLFMRDQTVQDWDRYKNLIKLSPPFLRTNSEFPGSAIKPTRIKTWFDAYTFKVF